MSTTTPGSSPFRRKAFRAAVVGPSMIALLLGGAGQAVAVARIHTLVVGLPDVEQGEGAVHTVVRGSGAVRTVTEAGYGLGHPGEENSRFGAAVLARDDLDGDSVEDMIVGAPGTGDRAGRVDVFFGTAEGVVADRAFTLESPAVAGDRFGAALSLGEWDDEEGSNRVRDLWVGAPGHDVAGQVDAGAVYHYRVSGGKVGYVEMVTENSPGVPGSAQAGDRFGGVMGPDGYAGMPGKDLYGLKDAGTVLDLKPRPVKEWNQNSAGVAGSAEAGDRFGAAIGASSYGDGLVIGAPGEDVGRVRDAGLVQAFYQGPSSSRADKVPWRAFTQDSAGVPGSAEAGDQFGAALASGVFQAGEKGRFYAVVGVPGEDIGTVEDAGAVTVIALRYSPDDKDPIRASRFLRQGDGLPGEAEAGDRTGAALGTIPRDEIEAESDHEYLLVGAPGEDVGAVQDRGTVIVDPMNAPSVSTGAGRPFQHFGAVLPQ
jgi:hypothetical protein